jgi:hypothetical protein
MKRIHSKLQIFIDSTLIIYNHLYQECDFFIFSLFYILNFCTFLESYPFSYIYITKFPTSFYPLCDSSSPASPSYPASDVISYDSTHTSKTSHNSSQNNSTYNSPLLRPTNSHISITNIFITHGNILYTSGISCSIRSISSNKNNLSNSLVLSRCSCRSMCFVVGVGIDLRWVGMRLMS